MRTCGRVAMGLFLAATCAVAACAPSTPDAPLPATAATVPGTASQANAALPRPSHVVVVVLENHGIEQVSGSGQAPYLNELAAAGAHFTDATAITHPSQPNYLALFSGDPQGVSDDSCPHTFTGPNLGSQLIEAGYGFSAFAEDLPSPGYPGCRAGDYVRWHAPWVDYATVPAAANRPFTAFGPDYRSLPTVSFVIPNMCHNMHDCDTRTADAWLRAHVSAYASWVVTHDSLLVVTFDEAEDASATNRIPLLLTGPMIRPGTYPEPVDHYRLLRTLEAMYGLPALGHAADTKPITDVWRP
ncbi:alkaline phosphatase family protein [Amycolatopsis sp. FDAARGOS 1241]|uniref:alkaline phosphatase family protein n=1 Tax=Amycolatopsis sp. FDAARGOS 1241 TaxID=2778070 RepID=UPI00194F57C1|nr:alkaline phosphatase family protein [Amycolatopsis sp. FDAARGOS 1241]QRP47875.1 acid phosphatase [Amycolatopsis sp. FDAARGOS 1241]